MAAIVLDGITKRFPDGTTAVSGRSLRALAAAKQPLMMVMASSRLMARIPVGLRKMVGWPH